MGGVGRINVAQDRDRWRAVVNLIINLWVPKNVGNFWSEEVFAYVLHGVGLLAYFVTL